MKRTTLLMLSILVMLGLTACSHEQSEPIDYYFCTTTPSVGEERWTLHVDGQWAGYLPYLSAVPTCSNTAGLSSMLHMSLAQGEHSYTARNGQGTIRSVGTFKCKDSGNTRKASIKGNQGGSTLDWSCNEVVMSIFE